MMLLRQTLSTTAALVIVAVVSNSRLIAETAGCGPFTVGQCYYWYGEGSSHHVFNLPGACMDGCHMNTQAGLCNVHNPADGCY